LPTPRSHRPESCSRHPTVAVGRLRSTYTYSFGRLTKTEGRYTPEQVSAVRGESRRITTELDVGGRWLSVARRVDDVDARSFVADADLFGRDRRIGPSGRVSPPFLIRTGRNGTPYHPPTVTATEGEIVLEATAPAAAPNGARL
jgi:hypothetical protein